MLISISCPELADTAQLIIRHTSDYSPLPLPAQQLSQCGNIGLQLIVTDTCVFAQGCYMIVEWLGVEPVTELP